MNIHIEFYAFMAAFMALVLIFLWVSALFRITAPFDSTRARRKKRNDAIVTTFNEHALFVVRLFLAFTVLYPSWVGFLYVAHLTKVF